jgi:hypothetical protein
MLFVVKDYSDIYSLSKVVACGNFPLLSFVEEERDPGGKATKFILP